MLRIVVDTNVVISSFLTKHKESPNKKLIDLWYAEKWQWLYNDDILIEYIAKLKFHKIDKVKIQKFIARLIEFAENIYTKSYHTRHYPDDSDDICFILCCINGNATHLVSKDKAHILPLRHFYSEFKICEVKELLKDLS